MMISRSFSGPQNSNLASRIWPFKPFAVLRRSTRGTLDAHFGAGELLLQKADIPGAVAEMKQACDIAPKDLRFALGLVRTFLKIHQNEEAEQVLKARLEAFPGSPELAYLVGMAQFDQGHYSDAVANFQRALLLNSKEHRASFMLGNAWAQLGDFKKSYAAYRSALLLSPNSALYYVSIASLLEREGELPEAAENLRKAIALEPGIPFSHYALGRISVQTGHYEEAIAELTRSLDLDPSTARPYYLLALCYERTGDQSECGKIQGEICIHGGAKPARGIPESGRRTGRPAVWAVPVFTWPDRPLTPPSP